MKHILFLIVLVFCSVQLLFGKEPVDTIIHNRQNCISDSLQIEKTKLEISELKNKEGYSELTWLLSLIGGVTGALTILWSIYHGVINYKTQIQQQKDKTISDLLVLINDENPNKRAGAAKGLSKYSNLATNEIISSIAIEKEDFIRDIIEETLLTLTKYNFEKVINANQDTLKKKVIILGELSISKISLEKIESILKISQEFRIQLTKNYRYLYDLGKRIAVNKNVETQMELPQEYIEKIQRIIRTTESTGRVIAKLLKNRGVTDIISHIDISYTELYRLKFIKQTFEGVYAESTICRHITFCNSNLIESCFKSADMFDANFINTTINFCNFSNSILRQSKGKNVIIEHSLFTEKAILSEGSFDRLKSVDNNFCKGVLKNFVSLNSEFINTKFHASELQHSNFSNSKFEQCEFFGASIAEGNFKNCKILNSKFNGADLRGTNFENAYLENVDFSGADLKNIRKMNWITVNCSFEKAKNFNNIINEV